MKPFNRRTWIKGTLAATTAACLLCISFAWADHKPDHNPPGGGGGKEEPAAFSVIELPLEGLPMLSEPGPDGIVTVAIDSAEAGYGSAAFAYVNRADGQVLASGFLPEPPFVDPNDGARKNGPSGPGDVNDFGDIVGYANTLDPEATGDPSPARAILWTDDGGAYSFVVLPLLPGAVSSRAFGINNRGDIVGSIFFGAEDTLAVAVLWDAASQSVIDLNSAATAAQGWELFVALDINDDGLIVGDGYLNGVRRGYLLDPVSETVWAVPFIGPAVSSTAWRINSNGRVVGAAWDGQSRHYGTDPDFILGYSWSGPGTASIALPSVTDNTGHAFGLNDHGATVGHSYIPTDDLFSLYTVPTLWEFDGNGEVIATELQSQIPSTPYTLVHCFDVNNDGWIGVQARKFFKGRYASPAAILVPNN